MSSHALCPNLPHSGTAQGEDQAKKREKELEKALEEEQKFNLPAIPRLLKPKDMDKKRCA